MPDKTWRPVRTFTPTNNDPGIIQSLPVGKMLSRYLLRFTGTLTVGVAAATILEDSPLGYLRSINAVLGGSFNLRVHDARFMRFWNGFQAGTMPRITAPLAAVGASNFMAEILLDFEQMDLLPPFDKAFWLDSGLLSSVDLVFATGADADVATPGGGGTAVLSNLSVQILAEEVPGARGLLSRMQITRRTQQITGAGDLDILLPGAGVAYRGVAIHATADAALTDPIRQPSSDAVITTVSLVDAAGRQIFDRAAYEGLRQGNKLSSRLEVMPAGWVVLDFAKDRTLAQLLRTGGVQNLTATLNVLAPANAWLQIYRINALLRRASR